METTVKKTSMPIIAGILAIASGGFKLLGLVGLIIAIVAVESNPYIDPSQAAGGFPVNVVVILWIIALPLAILGIFAVVGGIYALQRRKFGLAVIGSITSFLPFSFLGLTSIILIGLSKDEFE